MVADVKGKRVIVTGGSRGIGAAVARVFAKEGAKVATFDILDDLGQNVAAEATKEGPGSVQYFNVDVSNRDSVFAGVDAAVKELGGLDSLFNIAGIERRSSIEDMTERDLDAVLNVNVKGTFWTNQAVLPHLKEHGGSIGNFGSDAGLQAYPMGSHYSASKGAVHSFSRTAAAEWTQYNIRVNSVIPAIWTEMYDEHRARLPADQVQAMDEAMAPRVLGGKLGDPTLDLAPVLVFLASDASKFITGQIISVNGGLGSVR